MHTFVRAIVQVNEILLEFRRKSWGVNSITVVLTGNVALTGCQIQSGNVVSTVSVLELDGASTGCKSEKLVTETDTHDRDLGSLHETTQVVDGLLAMGWVTRAIRDEYTIEVVGYLVDGEIIWEDRNTGTTTDQASQNVLLDTAIDDSDMHITIVGADVEWSLGTDFLHQVDLLGIDESLVLIGVVFLSNCDSGQRRSNFSQVSDDGTGIDTGDGRNTFTSTPLAQTLHSSPVTVFLGIVCNNNTHALDVWGFEVFEEAVIISSGRGDTVVTDERLGEDKDLSTV